MDQDDVAAMIKGIIISHQKTFPLKNLESEFLKETGMCIPFADYEFDTLEAFVKSINGVQITKNCQQELVLKVERENSKSSHLIKLVKEQKKKVKKRNKSAPGRSENITSGSDAVSGSMNLISSVDFKSTADLTKVPEKKSNKRAKSKQKSRQPIKNLKTTENPTYDVRGLPFRSVRNDDKENVDTKEVSSCSHPTIISSKIDYPRKKCEEFGNKCVKFEQETGEKCGDCVFAAISNFLMVGDDIFYHFAKDHLGYPAHEGMVGICGLGLTIFEAECMFHKLQYFPENVIILLGATDVYLERPFDEIGPELYRFIADVQMLVPNVMVCTIPQLKSNKTLFDNLLRVNRLVRGLPKDFDNVEVIDLYAAFTCGSDVRFQSSQFYEENNNRKFSGCGYELLEKILKERLLEYSL